ncbi:MAG: hypothetical protein Q9167_000671 [Letrouitia subvulpina]
MASGMVQHEKQVVAEPKLLLAQLRGDDNWIPCGAFDSEMDEEIFGTERIYRQFVQIEPSYGYGGNVDSTLDDASNLLALNSMPHARPLTQIRENWAPRKTDGHTSKLPSAAQNKPSSETSSGSQTALEFKSQAFSGPKKEATKGNGEKPLDLEDIHAQVIRGRSSVLNQETRTQSPAEVTGMNVPQRADLEATTVGRNSSNPEDAISNDGTMRDVKDRTLTHSDDSIGRTSKAQEADKTGYDVAEQSKPITNLSEDEDVIMIEGNEQPNGGNEMLPVTHRMTTRGKAQVASDKTTPSRTRSVSPIGSVIPSIHPLFLMPESVGPDRDFGLPQDEAEATRRILMSYVQKQEEVCRGTEKLYNGLLKADRMRKTVFEWCKAEGHLGEMSDGEDWYDKEEWGLEEDLRKGHDDEEDEAITQHKKTRGRRA